MTEPLGRSQVLPYLIGLARAGWRIDLVAFEPESAPGPQIAALQAELADCGITYVWTRRSRSHALATKVGESARAFAALAVRMLRGRPRIIHARSYLPGAVAQAARAVSPGSRFLFDCRGLLGDEYVDFGHWSRASFRYRLLKRAERRLFGGADGVVVLTDRLRRWLRDEARLVSARTPVEVIPCCVDLAHFRLDEEARQRTRAELSASDRLLVAYSGTLGAWYCEPQMAALFAAVRRRRPARFLVLTRAPSDRLRAELRRHQVADEDVVVRAAAPAEMPALLNAADVGISFAEPRFSKIASCPVKVAEYLAVGAPVVINRGVGDQDALQQEAPQSLLCAGLMGDDELDAVAARVAALPPPDPATRRRHRAFAEAHFSLEQVGLVRYRRVYAELAS